jgi:hypothetical protein
MAHTIQNDRDLDLYAEACADDIIAEMGLLADEDDIQNSVHEYADGSEHVIYYYKAHAICQNCNTDSGEEFLADIGNPDPVTYDSLAVRCAIAGKRLIDGNLIQRINRIARNAANRTA